MRASASNLSRTASGRTDQDAITADPSRRIRHSSSAGYLKAVAYSPTPISLSLCAPAHNENVPHARVTCEVRAERELEARRSGSKARPDANLKRFPQILER